MYQSETEEDKAKYQSEVYMAKYQADGDKNLCLLYQAETKEDEAKYQAETSNDNLCLLYQAETEEDDGDAETVMM